MSRIDANYFRKKLKEEKENFELRVDEWLEKIALPYKWAEFINTLRNRGFIVSTQSMSDSSYIYLSIPSEE